MTYEASLPTITGKNLLTFEKAKDGLKHISEYIESDEAMKEDVLWFYGRTRSKPSTTWTSSTSSTRVPSRRKSSSSECATC